MTSADLPLGNSPPELPTKYYLDNFHCLLRQVADLYADLLTPSELEFYEDFTDLSEDAQCLYVRLVSRRGDWFREDKLNYPEIENLAAAAEELAEARFMSVRHTQKPDPDEIAEWLPLFTRPELADCVRLINKDRPHDTQDGQNGKKIAPSSGKTVLLEYLLAGVRDRPEAIGSFLPDTRLFCVFGEAELETFRLLFFGNLYQDFTEFVLRDLGIYRYESYQLDGESRWCRSRETLEAHKEYYHLREQAGDLRELSADELHALGVRVAQLISVQKVDAFSEETASLLKRRTDRFLVDAGRQLERLGKMTEALDIYQRADRHPARERRLRILVAQACLSEADKLAHEMHCDPLSEEEHQFLMSFVPRKMRHNADLCQQLKERISTPDERIMRMPAEQRLALGVERAVAAELEAEQPGDRLVYCENLLIPGVFGLLFWPAIYAGTPGAFYHPFQIRPSDLYDSEFAAMRKEELNMCWSRMVSAETMRHSLLETFHSKQGIANPFVHWGVLTEDLLTLATERIPVDIWQGLFHFLLKDLRHHKAGLPDLIRFPVDGGFELIEVKGPGDTLQKNQKAWFAEFSRLGVPAVVMKVKDSDSSELTDRN